MNEKHGKLIVLDGADRIGKKTATEAVVAALGREGLRVASMAFPQYDSPTGELIKNFLSGQFGDPVAVPSELASALYLLNRLEYKKKLEAMLTANDVVILDRYTPSNLLLQGVKKIDDSARQQFNASWAKLEYDTFGLPRPDLVIMLKGNPELSAALERGAKDGHETNTVYQKNIDAYLTDLLKEQNWQMVVTATPAGFRPKEEIAMDIINLIKQILNPAHKILNKTKDKLIPNY